MSDATNQRMELTYFQQVDEVENKILPSFLKSLPAMDTSMESDLLRFASTMHENLFSGVLTIEWTKEQCRITSNHISVRFEYYFHKTPRSYYVDLRLDAAKLILSNPRYRSLKIVTIALILGFNSDSAFIHNFRKREGVSPGEWRRLKLKKFS